MTGRTDHEITLDFLASHRIAGAETACPRSARRWSPTWPPSRR
jgi:hypothetical protein